MDTFQTLHKHGRTGQESRGHGRLERGGGDRARGAAEGKTEQP